MEAVVMLLFIIIYVACRTGKEERQKKELREELKSRGLYRDTPPDIMIQELRYDFREDWNGERKYFPKEYVEYMQKTSGGSIPRYGSAASMWIGALVDQEVAKRGYKPWDFRGACNITDVDWFDAFRKKYEDKIKLYNETGKLIM